LLTLVSLGLTLLGVLLYGYHCTEGDGGSPYVARDSPQKDVCEATGDGAWLLAVMVLLIAVFAFLAWRAFMGWRAGSRPRALLVAFLIAIPIAPLLAFLAANAPSDFCADAQEQAGADCDKY
jgi:cytochrome bd-type quinol oxidase subunit 1